MSVWGASIWLRTWSRTPFAGRWKHGLFTAFPTWGTDAGYAINPARDLGPRLASYLTGYGGAFRDQGGDLYLWVPIIGPLIGGTLGAGLYQVLIGRFLPAAPDQPDGATDGTPAGVTSDSASDLSEVRHG